MKVWQYRHVFIKPREALFSDAEGEYVNLAPALNEYGLKGWELVSYNGDIDKGFGALFKRERPNDALRSFGEVMYVGKR